MSIRICILGSIYPGNIKLFYSQNPGVNQLSYLDHYNLLLEGSTEFICAYSRNFNKLEIESQFIVGNDLKLQKKWAIEHDVEHNSSQTIIFEQVKKFLPDIFFIEDTQFIDKEWIEKVRKKIKGIKKIVAYNCAPYHSVILEKLRSVDLLITCTPGLKLDFEQKGIKSFLVYHGFDVNLMPKLEENNNFSEKDLIFTGSLFPGNGYHSERIELIETILNGNIDIALYVNLENSFKIKAKQSIHQLNRLIDYLKLGSLKSYFPFLEYGAYPVKNYSKLLYKAKQEAVYGLDMYKILAKSKVVLNRHVEVAGNYAGNMRIFETTGVGSCLLTDSKINLTELFEPDYEIVSYKNSEDCLSKIKWLMNNEQERKKIAEAGQQRIYKSHTLESRCRQMIEIFKQELKS
jgi:spore maturation protein CgeB